MDEKPRTKVGRRTLQKKYWESDIHCTMNHKEVKIFSTEFWPTLFGSSDLDLIGAKGTWTNIPGFTLYFQPSTEVVIDSIVVSLKRNGRTWFIVKKKIIPEIKMQSQDTFRLTIQMDESWNGK